MFLEIEGVGRVQSCMGLLNRVRRFKPEVSSEIEPLRTGDVAIGKLSPEDKVLLTAYQLVMETIIQHQGILCGGADVTSEDVSRSMEQLRFLETWSDYLYGVLESSLELRYAERIAAAAGNTAVMVRAGDVVVLTEVSRGEGEGIASEDISGQFLGERMNGDSHLPEVLRTRPTF